MESRIAATHRLQREGRWDEASAYRDEVRCQSRTSGLTRKQANEKAWECMIAEFPRETSASTGEDRVERLDDRAQHVARV